MADIQFVTPKPGLDGVNLRSRPVVDDTTRVGFLPGGMRLELEQDGPQWRACRVFVSAFLAEAQGDQFVQLKPRAVMANIRQAPIVEDATDVGDLNPGQQLELIQLVGDWWTARVFISTQFTDTGADDLDGGSAGGAVDGNVPPTGQVGAGDISTNGLELIKRFEGLGEKLYNDPVGHCTVGYGHLVHFGNCNGQESENPFIHGINDGQAEALLKSDLGEYMDAVRNSVTVPLTQNQFDALVSFTYNVGIGALRDSDLLILLNQGRYDTVPAQLNRWNKGRDAKGELVALPGLTARRKAEGDLFTKR